MWSTALVCNLGLSQAPLVLQASAMSVPTRVVLGWTPARPKASGITFLFQVWAEVWVGPKESCMIWWGHVSLFYKAHMMKFLQSWFVWCWKNRDQEALKRYSAPGPSMQPCRSILCTPTQCKSHSMWRLKLREMKPRFHREEALGLEPQSPCTHALVMAGRQCGERAVLGVRDGARLWAKSSDSKTRVHCTHRKLVPFAEK